MKIGKPVVPVTGNSTLRKTQKRKSGTVYFNESEIDVEPQK